MFFACGQKHVFMRFPKVKTVGSIYENIFSSDFWRSSLKDTHEMPLLRFSLSLWWGQQLLSMMQRKSLLTKAKRK